MGQQLLDQYSLLHFSVGVILYFWKIPLWIAILGHALFEWAENTEWGIRIINEYIIEPGYFNWPGGKYAPDAIVNRVGDVATTAVGWLSAAWMDQLGIQRGWYRLGLGPKQ